ncbi:hypothetical protein BGZ70_006835 [Mortierella alpina]|uniref:Glutathione S-transferase n=1 Tax=Mortierella alpina TaxID=64518 RepID=A0A9P6J7Q3_MORAP|nr:hypothetical protein BGZ70_006835 [Mortierella alpina]
MVATYPSTSNNADTTAQAAALDAADSTYSLLYMDTQGIVEPIRNLLTLGGATWTQLYPQDWENEDRLDKSSFPFDLIPVLYVHSKDGRQTVAIAESKVIELYLAKKFHCLGKNSYEQVLISSFVSSIAALWDDVMYSALALQASAEVKQEQLDLCLTKKIPTWVRIHEEHLKANGDNGHYVGDSISLADLRAAALLDIILRFPASPHLLTQEMAPGLFKVKAMVDQHPKIAQWRETELYKTFRSTRRSPSMPRPNCIRLNDRQGNKTGGLVQ